MTRISQEALDELVALEKKATPGQWRRAALVWLTTDEDEAVATFLGDPSEDNLRFVAALRTAAPALLAEVVESRKLATAARGCSCGETGSAKTRAAAKIKAAKHGRTHHAVADEVTADDERRST